MSASPQEPLAARSAEGRVPEFFIVGNPKSGTTALYEMLRPHPQIYMPELGTQFFASEQKQDPATLEEYLALFDAARPQQRVGEMSRGYFRSKTAASAIAALRPDARIIVILREPTSFLRSLHLELLQDHVESERRLRTAIAREQELRRGQGTDSEQSPFDWEELRYSPERVAYVEQLRRYHAVFPAEQVLVLIYDDFRTDNEATVRQVLRFLDVDDASPIHVTDANPTVQIRSPRLHGAVRSLYLGDGPAARALKTGVKAVTTQQLRREGLRTLRRNVLYGRPDPVDEELVAELRQRSKNEVVALSEYLDRDLVTLWGYDKVT